MALTVDLTVKGCVLLVNTYDDYEIINSLSIATVNAAETANLIDSLVRLAAIAGSNGEDVLVNTKSYYQTGEE